MDRNKHKYHTTLKTHAYLEYSKSTVTLLWTLYFFFLQLWTKIIAKSQEDMFSKRLKEELVKLV